MVMLLFVRFSVWDYLEPSRSMTFTKVIAGVLPLWLSDRPLEKESESLMQYAEPRLVQEMR